jgi:methenyltetrahydrofolate cyclohydrolase
MSLVNKTVADFNNELASTSPAPGGGSVSALAGSMGTALISMVCQLTIGKKKYLAVEEDMKQAYAKSESLRIQITELIDKDTDAFNQVMAAFALPKAADEEKAIRDAAIEAATKEATLIPLEVMKVCREAIGLSLIVATKGNTNALSDAGVSALMLKSACRGAYYNVKINLASLKDTNFISNIHRQANELLAGTDKTAGDVLKHVETSWT